MCPSAYVSVHKGLITSHSGNGPSAFTSNAYSGNESLTFTIATADMVILTFKYRLYNEEEVV